MIYLSGVVPKSPDHRARLARLPVGIMATPLSAYSNELIGEWVWAADNGCFSAKWDSEKWVKWLDRMAPLQDYCLFAVVPDVVGDAEATLALWSQWVGAVRERGYAPAFVLQDGYEPGSIPSDAAAVFVGGSTEFKLSDIAREAVAEAKGRDMWAHMGRVNSKKRVQLAASWGCDSTDGTLLAFGADANLPRLESWFAVT